MAVPFINLFANTMGGIGFIELADLNKLGELKQETGVPFYAGRFYPKNTADEWNFLSPGLLSQTPPFIGWKDFGTTQIWMVPAFEDERIATMKCEVTHINLWPRDSEEEEAQGEYTPTSYDNTMQSSGWTSDPTAMYEGEQVANIDPGVIITNDVVPPGLFLGYVGISEVSGRVTEYGWYDQEMIIVNSTRYEQSHFEFKAKNYRISQGFANAEEEIDFLQNFNSDTYQEILRIRTDGVWRKRGFNIAESAFDITSEEYTNPATGLPHKGFERIVTSASADMRNNWFNWTYSSVQTASEGFPEQRERTDSSPQQTPEGNPFTRYEAGIVQQFVPSRLNTLVYTIKVSCTSVIVPDTIPEDTATALNDMSAGALEIFGANLTNEFWYFYMPVVYNGDYMGDRISELTSRGAINNTDIEDL